MTRFLRLCIVVLALALVAGGSALPSPAAAVETSTYTGTVVAQDGTVVDYSGSWWEVQVFDMNGTQIAAGGINRKTGAFTTTPFPTQPVQISTNYW